MKDYVVTNEGKIIDCIDITSVEVSQGRSQAKGEWHAVSEFELRDYSTWLNKF